ncbi:MarR family winged helix-turn-helix transcriptional regulator [Aquitalea aquatica]|uniref:MarR family transcriptional regulator n=1 Tax=Aquitalea aquatica TaxID=3044273 RepID=A0A838YCX4_9NEIS|nr:MarR family transcriptional regulator [Aquitalea magnusonii]MBA4710327.1 MarR family transcriptional regulator [Aquitalea magnusonii]
MNSVDLLRLGITSAIMHAGRKWRHISQDVVFGHGLTAPCATALIFIGRLGEGINQIALAEEIGIEGPSLVRVIDQLAADGLVRREKGKEDRRSNTLWFTESGRALTARIEAELVALRTLVFKDVTPADLEATLRVFAAVESAYQRPGLVAELAAMAGQART